jgi:hypothetical protein
MFMQDLKIVLNAEESMVFVVDSVLYSHVFYAIRQPRGNLIYEVDIC